jgi:hypothetical protein
MREYVVLRNASAPKTTGRIRTRGGLASPFDFSVRPEGAYHQWREVPPGELSVCSGSWRAARLGDGLGRSLVTKAALGGRAIRRAVT